MTNQNRRLIRVWLTRLAWVVLGLSLAACSGSEPAAVAPEAANMPEPAVFTPTAVLPPTLFPPTRTPDPVADGVNLTWWMEEEIAPGTTPAGRVLRNQVSAFSGAHANITIDIVPKKSSGKGGLLDFLTTTRSAFPARLPDLIALDLADVPAAAQAGLIQPLDALVPADVSADLFPFAYQSGRVHGRWVAVPFATDVEHLVYNKNSVRKAPATWDEFTKQKGTLLLPLGGDDAFLLQYLALGATLVDSTNQPGIDPNAAAQTLAFFKRARDLGLIPDAALYAKSVGDVWPGFASGQAAMAQVSASRYLAERAKVPSASFASVPTREGTVSTLATGYALAIVATNPTRQAAAARFIQWIVQGERLAPWLRAVHLLPANRGTMVMAVDPSEYVVFLHDQLENALLIPSAPSFARQADAWRGAISVVWKGQQTPEEAARLAATLR